MNKAELNAYISEKLTGKMSESDIEKTQNFYSEIVDDRMEDGMSEEEAVAALGDLDAIVKEILLDAPLTNLVKAKLKPRAKMRGWEIALLIIGFPLWFPLLVSIGAVVMSVYLVVWSLIAALFAVVFAFAVGGLAGIVNTVMMFSVGISSVIFMLGASCVLLGLAVLTFYGVKELTKRLIRFTGRFTRAVKSVLINKEDA